MTQVRFLAQITYLVEHTQGIVEDKRFCAQAKLGNFEIKRCPYSRTSQRL